MGEIISTLIKVAVVSIIMGLIVGFFMAWPAMLMFGVVHSFWPFIPAFSLWQSFLVVFLARLIVPSPINNGS